MLGRGVTAWFTLVIIALITIKGLWDSPLVLLQESVTQDTSAGTVLERGALPPVSEEVFQQLQKDIESRNQIGFDHYKTSLTTFNGRDALRDAYEEALDMCAYLCQAIMERDALGKVQVQAQ